MANHSLQPVTKVHYEGPVVVTCDSDRQILANLFKVDLNPNIATLAVAAGLEYQTAYDSWRRLRKNNVFLFSVTIQGHEVAR